MNFTTDRAALRWATGNATSPEDKQPLKIKRLFPEEYKAYFALLPVVGIIDDFPFSEVQPNALSIEQTNRNAKIWTRYNIYSAHASPAYRGTNFRELAALFDLPSDYQLAALKKLPWNKKGFDALEDETYSTIGALLKSIAHSAVLNLYIEDAAHYCEVYNLLPTPEEVIYRVTAEDFIQLFRQHFSDAGLCLFPDDKSWCLINREAEFCPLLATSAESGEKVAAQSILEVLSLDGEEVL